MKTLTREQIKEILRKHKIWLEDSSDEEAERADLREADLQGQTCKGQTMDQYNVPKRELL